MESNMYSNILELSTLRLHLSAPIILYWYDNTLYKDVGGIIYRYSFITSTAWNAIKADALLGDTYSLDMYTEYIPSTIVRKVPPQADRVVIYVDDGVKMYKVDSSNIDYVGYDAEELSLYVKFKGDSNDVYRYDNVTPDIWAGLEQADSKGSFIHFWLKINSSEYPYQKVSDADVYYSNEYTPNPGTPHEHYMTNF